MADDDNQKPSNRDYLSYYIKQNEWVPTKPRKPVAASVKGPGPAAVNLPTTVGEMGHDPTKHRQPGYFMGLRAGIKDKGLGPGPAKYDLRGWTNKGIDKCCAPYLVGKPKDLMQFRTPGPAAYSREECDKSVYPRAPSFTCRIKPEPVRRFRTPAPNAYNIPVTVGPGEGPYPKAPAYSMRLKLAEQLETKIMNPGPAAYMLPSSNVTKNKPPAYTMSSNATPPTDRTGRPGPGAHSTELVKVNKHSGPRITFGIKHTPYEAFPGFAAEKD